MESINLKKKSKLNHIIRRGNEHIVYISGGNESGTGVGMYEFNASDGTGGRYFYYGNYDKGKRSGKGYTFACIQNDMEDAYETFEGNWENDAPNGEFIWDKTEYVDGAKVDYHTTGTYKNGLEDGEFEQHVITPYFETTIHWTSENGVAPDIYDSITDKIAKESLKSFHDEGYAIIAYSVIREGDQVFVWRAVSEPGEVHGVCEFAVGNKGR